jgi:hypothetical protein
VAASPRGALAALLLLLLVAALAWRSVVDLDFGIHIASGRWILQNGRVPDLDPFTYTISDHAYLAYHWLYQVSTYALYRSAGVPGVCAARLAIALAAALLIADVLRVRRISALAGAAVGLAAILAAESRLRDRPELVSYLLAAATLWVVERRRQHRRAPLWLLPAIQLAWVNTHVHAFGWGILGVYAADEALRARSLRTPLVGWCGVSALALLVNPYHVGAALHPLLLATRMSGENVFSQEIFELGSPLALARLPAFRSMLAPALAAHVALLAIGALAVVDGARMRRFTDVALVAVFGALSLLAVRNVALFAVVAAPSLAAALDARLSGTRRRRLAGAALAAILGFTALTTARVALSGFYSARGRPERFGAELCRRCLSVDAVEWLADRNLVGPGFNNLNIGATLLWRDPAHKVFIDGRNEVTGEEFFRRYLEVSRPDRWDEESRRYGFEYAVLAYAHDQPLAGHLLRDAAWKLVYLDGAAVVFVREGGPNADLPEAELPAPVGRAEREEALGEIHVDGSRAARLARWLGLGPPPRDADLALGSWLLALGQLAAAERPLLRAAIGSPQALEPHNNLAVLYYRARLWREALVCLRNLSALSPDHASLAWVPEIEAHLRQR